MTTVNHHEAKTHLSRLVDRAANGEKIVIARAGTPIARLVALVLLASATLAASPAPPLVMKPSGVAASPSASQAGLSPSASPSPGPAAKSHPPGKPLDPALKRALEAYMKVLLDPKATLEQIEPAREAALKLLPKPEPPVRRK